MKTFLVRDDAAFKLRVKVNNCIRPSDLKHLQFIGEQYNDKGEMIETSTYDFFLEDQHINTLIEGLK